MVIQLENRNKQYKTNLINELRHLYSRYHDFEWIVSWYKSLSLSPALRFNNNVGEIYMTDQYDADDEEIGSLILLPLYTSSAYKVLISIWLVSIRHYSPLFH